MVFNTSCWGNQVWYLHLLYSTHSCADDRSQPKFVPGLHLSIASLDVEEAAVCGRQR